MPEPSLSLSEFAQAAGLSYQAARDFGLRGRVRMWKDSRGQWRVASGDAAGVVQRLKAARAISADPPTDSEQATHGLGLFETLARMHALGRSMATLKLEFDSRLEGLRADGAEAAQRGDTSKAEELLGLADLMASATYGVDANGRFVLGVRQEDGTVVPLSPAQPA